MSNWKSSLMLLWKECNRIQQFLQKTNCNYKFPVYILAYNRKSLVYLIWFLHALDTYATVVLCCKESLLNSNNIWSFQYLVSSQDCGAQHRFGGKCYINLPPANCLRAASCILPFPTDLFYSLTENPNLAMVKRQLIWPAAKVVFILYFV